MDLTPEEINQECRRALQHNHEAQMREGEPNPHFIPTLRLYMGESHTIAGIGSPIVPGCLNLAFRLTLAIMYMNQPNGPRCLDAITAAWDGLVTHVTKEQYAAGTKPDLNADRAAGKKVQDVLFVLHCTPGKTDTFFNEYDTEDNIFTWGKMETLDAALEELPFGTTYSAEWTYEELTRDITIGEFKEAITKMNFPPDLASQITTAQIKRMKPKEQREELTEVVKIWDALPEQARANAPEGLKELVDILRDPAGAPSEQLKKYMSEMGLTP